MSRAIYCYTQDGCFEHVMCNYAPSVLQEIHVSFGIGKYYLVSPISPDDESFELIDVKHPQQNVDIIGDALILTWEEFKKLKQCRRKLVKNPANKMSDLFLSVVDGLIDYIRSHQEIQHFQFHGEF
ncbi:hypothetical protein [Gimesia aquarii]|uniref:Uncharacterized protein n=1 Tax=Gimesia aquarii TaxID=2527964 RepID=A0A517WSB4_9PLAN|nr:hypothetical protein [Gimesia aquarii]QDU08149.1 hypothetical protein V202x_15130 [Gimesia aquarii]